MHYFDCLSTRGAMDWCLHFSKFPTVLEGFCNANWVSDNDEVSYTIGYAFILGRGAISWKFSKQTSIAQSTIEDEFIALKLIGPEAKWLKGLLGDMLLWGGSLQLFSFTVTHRQ